MVVTYCCVSVTRSKKGVIENCQRGPGRNENVPLTRRVEPPYSSPPRTTEVDSRVGEVTRLPALIVMLQTFGLAISGPPRVSDALIVRSVRVTDTELVQKFFHVTLSDGWK